MENRESVDETESSGDQHKAVSPPDDPAQAATQRAHNRQLLRKYIDGILGEGNMAVVDEIYHEEIEINARPADSDRTIEDPAEIKQYMRNIRDRFADLDTEIDVIVADQNAALAEFTATGVHQDDYFGVDPSEREVSFPVFSKAIIEDGKIIDQGDIVNPLRMQPDAKRYGRSTVLDQIREGILVVDTDNRVVDTNPVAQELLGVDNSEILGEPLEPLFDADVTLPAVGSAVEVQLHGGRMLEISASELLGAGDKRIGRIFLLQDVTERVRRRQQLEVLNRVLRHNLRNKLTGVIGRTEFIADHAREENPDTEKLAELADDVTASAKKLADLGMTARKIEQAVSAADETHPLSLANVATRAVERGRELYPQATIEAECTDVTVDGPPALDDVVWELVENALEHTGGDKPRITVHTERDGDSGRVVVADEGDGVPDIERSVLAAGRETQLEHASGLGLWFVHLATTMAGGELTFDDTHSMGNAVSVSFPIADDPGAAG